MEYLSVRAEGEIRRVNDAAPFFPVGADAVGIFRYFEAITDGKCRAGLCHHLLGFIERVYRQGDDVGVLGCEFF